MLNIRLIILLILLFLNSCSKDVKISENIIKNDDMETEMIRVYKEE